MAESRPEVMASHVWDQCRHSDEWGREWEHRCSRCGIRRRTVRTPVLGAEIEILDAAQYQSCQERIVWLLMKS